MEARSAQPRDYEHPLPVQEDRRPVYHPNTALGVIGHVVKTAGILAPLIIGEIVKDGDKRWRYIRIASVATALLSEGLYTQRVQQERKERDTRRERY